MIYSSKKGFILVVVLMLCLIMAAFIVSYNSIVRSRNLQAHHYMSSEVVGNLAVSGVKLLASKLELSFVDVVREDCPQLFAESADRIAQPINLSSLNSFCGDTQRDFQRFLNEIDELKEVGVIGGGLPVCEKMEVTVDQLRSLAPETSAAQLQRGRDPVEKCGMLNFSCTVRHFGVVRKASISQQFRIVNMSPGPVARFSLFLSRTPYPDSYNAMGVNFDGDFDSSYTHAPAGNKAFRAPFLVLNGTDTETISSSVSFRNADEDKKHLRERGWIYIGASGPDRDAPVYLKVPNGYSESTGGLFMFGPPSNSLPKLLAPAGIEHGSDFQKSENLSGHDFYLGSKYHGYYTTEEDNALGVGAKNLWPGLTIGDSFQPSDRFLSASTWLYPFGNMKQSSRTLVIGPVLAGYLKYNFIKGKDVSGNEYRGLFGSLTQASFEDKKSRDLALLDYCFFWSGLLEPPITASDFFLNDYNSFKKLMPWNSLPSRTSTSLIKGVAFNMIFDFMKYDRTRYPDTDVGPVFTQPEFFNQKSLAPMAQEMLNSDVKGVHPSGDLGIYFRENGDYNPNSYPENCFFFGDLANYSVSNSSLVSNRITNIIDLSDCKSLEEENEQVEKILFREVRKSGKTVNEPRKTGIYFIRRREGVSASFEDALSISSREIDVSRPIIVVIGNGSLNLSRDIISDLKDGAPEFLMTLAVCQGDVYLSGNDVKRTIHAYVTAVSSGYGRLLRPPGASDGPDIFEIFGGLALTEAGLYPDKAADPRSDVGSTMLSFPGGGKVIYNSRFNPSLPGYADSYHLVMEPIAGTLSIRGDN